MHADDALGLHGGARDGGHEQRRGVGREHALVRDDLLGQAREQLVLDLQALGRGFDHELAGREVLERGRGLEPPGRVGGLRCAQAAALDAALELGPDPAKTPLERVGQGSWSSVRAPDRQASCAIPAPIVPAPATPIVRAGGPAPRDHAGTSALIPVRARPMISFWICEVPSYSVVTRASRR